MHHNYPGQRKAHVRETITRVNNKILLCESGEMLGIELNQPGEYCKEKIGKGLYRQGVYYPESDYDSRRGFNLAAILTVAGASLKFERDAISDIF